MRDHRLLTIQTPGYGYVHAYLIYGPDPKRTAVDAILSRMFSEAEKVGPPPLPIVLETILNKSGIAIVEKILRAGDPQVAKLLDTYADTHCTIWATPPDGADVDQLLH